MAKPFYRDPRRELRPVPFAKPLILCIEDDDIYLQLRKAVLEKQGYNVIGATTIEDAITVLREAPVCCIIADHVLRGKTGQGAAKQMKRIKPDVPLVLFSGTLPEKLDDIDVYVNKGEPTAVLLKIVRDLTERFSS